MSVIDGQELVQMFLEKLSSEEAVEACTVARMIWMRRNSFVFTGEFTPPIKVVERSRLALAEFSATHHSSTIIRDTPPMTPPRWTKSPDGKWKINADAAVDKVARKMRVGVVIRDAGGRVVAA
jgi:hypothetical protein